MIVTVLEGGYLVYWGGETDKTVAWEANQPLNVTWAMPTMKAFHYLDVPPMARLRTSLAQGRFAASVGRPEAPFLQVSWHPPEGDRYRAMAELTGEPLMRAVKFAQTALIKQAETVREAFRALADAQEVVTVGGAPFAVLPLGVELCPEAKAAATSRGLDVEPFVLFGRAAWGGGCKGLAFRQLDDANFRVIVLPQPIIGAHDGGTALLMQALATEWPDAKPGPGVH